MLSYIWANGAIESALGALVLAALFGVIIGVRRARPRDGVVVGLLALPATAILGATLTRYGWPSTFDLRGGVDWSSGGWLRFTTEFGHSEEVALNIMLFIPAGLIWSLASRSPLAVFAILAASSAAIEFVQGLLSLGTPDLSDFLSNSVGAGMGALVGAVIACLWAPSGRRRPYWAVGGLLLATVVLTASVPAGAAHRQKRLEQDLTARFAGLTLADYKRWSSNGEIGDRVFAIDGIFSSGAQQEHGQAVVRYPTSFMWIDQCVTATWTADGVDVAAHNGGYCTRFLG